MDEEMRVFGYLCPACGKPVMRARSVFALAASDAEAGCSCGKSVLRTDYDGERWRLTVPCGLCGETHTAVCGPDRMLHGATALACARTKQFCCFIGPEETVGEQLQELEILAEKEKHGEQEVFADHIIIYEVLSELKDIASRTDGIRCACGSRRYGIEIRRSAVDLACRDCGAKLRIPAATDKDLDDLCCHMKLVIPGEKDAE